MPCNRFLSGLVLLVSTILFAQHFTSALPNPTRNLCTFNVQWDPQQSLPAGLSTPAVTQDSEKTRSRSEWPDVQPPQLATNGPKSKAQESEKADARKGQDSDAPLRPADLHNPVLWRDLGELRSLNLFYGQGGKDGMPTGPFTFEAEDSKGTNPKFDVRDAKGNKWRVKLGREARPEVVASRLLWAAGYFVNEDYVLESADVQGLHLQRGGSMAKNGHIVEARFARRPDGQKKIGIWKWKQNPFTDARELNGLRVMMALMNNWDLKDVNNAVFYDKKTDREIFLTSDIGATFGSNGPTWTKARGKGNIESFKHSRFIRRVTDTRVDFATPRRPTPRLIESLGFGIIWYARRSRVAWIGRNIPRADARWIGSLLGQLTHQQLVDGFRAGHFPREQIQDYVAIVESRIQELGNL